MKRAKKLGCMMLICTLFFTMMMPYQVFAADNSKAASIVDMEGKVQILKAGGEKAFSAFKGMNLTQGDRIITGKDAWVKLDIDQNKEMKLAENTDMTMSELLGSVNAKNDQTFLNLLVGKAWIFIKEKLNVNAKFEIKTPTTVMGVRGTQFFVQEQDGQTYVTVVEGTVAASTYAVVENPDGTIQLKPVEVTLNHNQQVAFDAGVRSGEAPQVQEAQLENMDRFMLEAIRDSVPGLAPGTVERMDRLIEQRRAEEVQQQQQPQQDEIVQNSIIWSLDTTTTSSGMSSGGNGESSPVVVPVPKISTVNAVNGTISVVFDRNLSSAPQKDDFEVKQNVYEADAVLMDITQVQWDNGSNVTLKVGPLQPGAYEQEFYYSVQYKEDAAVNSKYIIVPYIVSGEVSVVGTGLYYANEDIQLAIKNVATNDGQPLNHDDTFNDSSFNIKITSNLEASDVFNDYVPFGTDGYVAASSQPNICLTEVGRHNLSVYINDTFIDSLEIIVDDSQTMQGLIGLSVKENEDGSGTELIGSTFFDPNTFSYTVDVPYTVTHVKVIPTIAGGVTAAVTDKNHETCTDGVVSLKGRTNIVFIVVTQEGRQDITYTVFVNRASLPMEVISPTGTIMQASPFELELGVQQEYDPNTRYYATVTSDDITEGEIINPVGEGALFYGYVQPNSVTSSEEVYKSKIIISDLVLIRPGSQKLTVKIHISDISEAAFEGSVDVTVIEDTSLPLTNAPVDSEIWAWNTDDPNGTDIIEIIGLPSKGTARVYASDTGADLLDASKAVYDSTDGYIAVLELGENAIETVNGSVWVTYTEPSGYKESSRVEKKLKSNIYGNVGVYDTAQGHISVEGVRVVLKDYAGNEVTHTLTESNGDFLIQDVLIGKYIIEFSKEGYKPGTYEYYNLGSYSTPIIMLIEYDTGF
ncbi:FecR domain-containing protein [Petroclostridium sp. X23]|uniref:FecR domain-containing protein n=1 Tax=Petroclostridium sp. X23 TaxID=3045146 RepID=UPI0024ACCD14|nr:FecR domain-containing protein [Petroclostridium sp. X23]WHH61073.1 FecR domain-containing protein [Petroclostridium sp. X23]